MESPTIELPPSRAPFRFQTHRLPPPPPEIFAVISWGCAGTKWAALALNSHPDVFCVHSANYYLQSMAQQRLVDGCEYLRVLESIGSGHRAIGEVHGVSRESIAELRAHYGARFSTAILVRDPLPRLRSQVALSRKLQSGAAWDKPYYDRVAQSAGLDPAQLTYEDSTVVHAADMLNRILEERQFGPVFTLESLAQSRTRLSELLLHLTRGRVTPTREWLDHVGTLPAQNQHQAEASAPLTDRELRIADRIFRPEARECYRQLGYHVPVTL